jgi:hypothetical protein
MNKAFMDGAVSPAMAGSANRLNYKTLADNPASADLALIA